MNIGKTIYVTERKQWRAWLKKNYKIEKEIWLIYPKKSTGKARISYNDAVEEALCFGWIDSTAKKYDDDNMAQRFSPRNPNSKYSQANKERLKELARKKRIVPSVLLNVQDVLKEKFIFPEDIRKEINSNKQARQNFARFSQAYQRIRIAFIDGARNRPDEFRKRLEYFLKMTAANKQFGFGGIDKYYR